MRGRSYQARQKAAALKRFGRTGRGPGSKLPRAEDAATAAVARAERRAAAIARKREAIEVVELKRTSWALVVALARAKCSRAEAEQVRARFLMLEDGERDAVAAELRATKRLPGRIAPGVLEVPVGPGRGGGKLVLPE